MGDAIVNAFSLYVSTVMHRRHFPQSYKFTYQVFSLLLDIDRLEEHKEYRFLSHNRFNLFSIQNRDHGARDGSAWRPWINNLLDKESLENAKHTIKLLCFPRVLGYAFNPISLWYCYGEDKNLYAIICEVSNTFGEHHHYVLHNHNKPYEQNVDTYKAKNFHVSPFIGMTANYHFLLEKPSDDLRIIIDEYQDEELMLTATQIGKKLPLTNTQLLRQFFLMPFMTAKIMIMIHWQALKIWRRGGTFHKKPPAPKTDYS